MKTLVIIGLCIFGLFLRNVVAEDMPRLYVNKISKVAVPAICNDSNTLKKMGVAEKKCVEKLNSHVDYCNNTVMPLVPEITGEQSREVVKTIFASLGEVYAMCLKSLAYEN